MIAIDGWLAGGRDGQPHQHVTDERGASSDFTFTLHTYSLGRQVVPKVWLNVSDRQWVATAAAVQTVVSVWNSQKSFLKTFGTA